MFGSFTTNIRKLINLFYPYLIRMKYNIFLLYFNKVTHPHLLTINIDVTLSDLKYQLNQMDLSLKHRKTRRVVNVEYRYFSVDDDGGV